MSGSRISAGADLADAFAEVHEGKVSRVEGLLGTAINDADIEPPFLLIHGQPGVGKTTLAAGAPSPFFIFTEKGRGKLKVGRLPGRTNSWDSVIRQVGALYEDAHDYKTLVIDSISALEPLLFEHTARKHGKADIEAFGYGKGFSTYAPMEMRVLTDGLEALREDRGMAVILIAHSDVTRFEAPDTDPYDTYSIRMHKHLRPIVEQSADIILFEKYRVMVKHGEERFGKTATRGIGEGERVLCTEERPAWTAKNRYGLSPEISLPMTGDPAVLWGVLMADFAQALSENDSTIDTDDTNSNANQNGDKDNA